MKEMKLKTLFKLFNHLFNHLKVLKKQLYNDLDVLYGRYRET